MDTKPKRKHRALKITAIGLATVLLVATVAFLVYTQGYARAGSETAAAYTTPSVEIVQGKGYTLLMPEDGGCDVGFVLYPGGLVDAEAYLLYLADIAAAGYPCAVVEVPLHLAFFGQSRADRVKDALPAVELWVVGGHSLGGVVASGYAEKHTDTAGLVLLASYPSADLSATGLPVLSITASEDEVLNWEAYNSAVQKLPQGTQYVIIEGGNHGGFGDYGVQKGDGSRTISAAQQREEAVGATVDFLDTLAAA